MTRFRSIIIMNSLVEFIDHKNAETAEEFEYRMKEDPDWQSHFYGDINGEAYTVVYFRKSEQESSA